MREHARLAATTEIHKLIPKKKVVEHFGAEMSAARRKKFDADIARMALVNEVSPLSVNLPVGDTVKNFFVLQVGLKPRLRSCRHLPFWLLPVWPAPADGVGF